VVLIKGWVIKINDSIIWVNGEQGVVRGPGARRRKERSCAKVMRQEDVILGESELRDGDRDGDRDGGVERFQQDSQRERDFCCQGANQGEGALSRQSLVCECNG